MAFNSGRGRQLNQDVETVFSIDGSRRTPAAFSDWPAIARARVAAVLLVRDAAPELES
jgi:hypothetical protein